MVVIGAGKLMPPGTIRLRPGKIKIVVGAEIPVGAEEDTRALKEKAFAKLEEMLKV
jgi:1-acyl-sn-glycerol-3-phosphate acyltransferase